MRESTSSGRRYGWLLLFTFACATSSWGAGSDATTFTQPRRGDTIQNRSNFTASLQIDAFTPSHHYWVAIASVQGHEPRWHRVLELRALLERSENPAAKAELLEVIGDWEADLLWPKFYVPRSPYVRRVFDGGVNPLEGLEPQPMILLVLRVDDMLHSYFRMWFHRGSSGTGYPGIPATRLSNDAIVARCEIFFP